MYAYEKSILNRITVSLRKQLSERIIAVYAFGSKARGDYGEWSDFDVLVVVKDREPLIENKIMGIFVEEEFRSGMIFTPVIKDLKAFENEKSLKTPFYENIMKEGILL